MGRLLAEESTCLGLLGWWTTGRSSSDLLDMAERSLEADITARRTSATSLPRRYLPLEHTASRLSARGRATIPWQACVPAGGERPMCSSSRRCCIVVLSFVHAHARTRAHTHSICPAALLWRSTLRCLHAALLLTHSN